MSDNARQVQRFSEGTRVSDTQFRRKLNALVENSNSFANSSPSRPNPAPRSRNVRLANITGTGSATGHYEGVEANPDGTNKSGGVSWDGNDLAELVAPGEEEGWESVDVPVVVVRVPDSSVTPVWVIAGSGSRKVWVELTGNTATGVNDGQGNPVQWTYSAKQVDKTGTGYGGWSDVSGGWTGTAYNPAEEPNGTGVQGNGVDHSSGTLHADNNFQMQPLTTGLILRARLISVGGTVEAWLSPIANGEDGSCGS